MRKLAAAALAVVASALAVLAVLSASGAGGEHGLEVALDEWDLRLSHKKLQAGTIDLVQRNTGRLEHEVLIVRTGARPDDLPVGLEGVKPSVAGEIVFGSEHTHHAGQMGSAGAAHLAPGETRRQQVRLAPGRYVLLCGIDGHYQAGQRAALKVE